MTKLLIGADPEFFLKKDGKFVSAHGLIKGTKKNPQKVKGGAVQVDGMALEFNVNPAEKFVEFEQNMTDVLTELRAMVPLEYEFAFVPVADFDEEYIKNQPEEARMLGCDPDFNAYTGQPNNPPNAAANFRTASGHFHLGWTEDEDIKNPEHIEACEMMTGQLDNLIGLKSVVFDLDTRRRELYGKAGAYRPKPYGVEYRVLSNFWLNSVDVRRELFSDIKQSFDALIGGKSYEKALGANIAQRHINNSGVATAYDYINYHFGNSKLLDEAFESYAKIAHAQAIGDEKKVLAKKKRGVVKKAFDPFVQANFEQLEQIQWVVNRAGPVNIEIGAQAPALHPWDQRPRARRPAPQPVNEVGIIDDFDIDWNANNA